MLVILVVIVIANILIEKFVSDTFEKKAKSIHVFNHVINDEHDGSNGEQDLPKIEVKQNKLAIRNPDLLLNVPFYVYEDEFLNNVKILNITKMYEHAVEENYHENSKSTNSANGNVTFLEFAETFKYFKHWGDVHFIRSALQHPMRVLNPEDAKIFVVPSLLTYDITTVLYHGREVRYPTKIRLTRMNKELRRSPWFQRNNGADHIAPVAYFLAEGLLQGMFPILSQCNLVQFSESSLDPNYILPKYQQNRTMFKIFKVGSPCKTVKFFQKTRDYAFVGKLHGNKHYQNRHYKNRRDVCKWMNTTNHSSSVCGLGYQCPHLSQALLGFHIRGDSISSNRLFDTLLSATVPVFTLKLQYGAQPEWYDWDKIIYFANA